jgi:TRAP-type C4-dicarboxylate transport system permease small subunit
MTEPKQKFRIDHLIVAILLFLMAAIAFVNVLSRYIFHFSLAATEELTINLFVWVTVIGTGIAFERGGQLGMVTFFNLFPRRLRKVAVAGSALLSAALFLVVNIFMIQAIYDEVTLFHAKSGSLAIPVWVYYLGVPVFSIFVFQGIYRNAATRLMQFDERGLE